MCGPTTRKVEIGPQHISHDPSSFRDPAGFIFLREGILYRQINVDHEPHYDRLIESNLYKTLTSRGLLVEHEERSLDFAALPGAFKVIEPERVDVITYPYEWCFSQLKDAALTTLEIQRLALDHGMWLKDASAYNVQFQRGRPILIDTLSLETYLEGRPWTAYRQFCGHFLAPLMLASRVDVRLSGLLRVHLDGIPLDLVSQLLPSTSWFSLSTLAHIHLHSRSQRRFADPARWRKRNIKVSRAGMIGLIDSLRRCLEKLEPRDLPVGWANYYRDTNYSDEAMRSKESAVETLLEKIRPRPQHVVDLGANTGRFSRLADRAGFKVVAADADPIAVEKHYRELKSDGITGILPIVVDLLNPSSDSGWANRERPGFMKRMPSDTVLGLGLVHHLAIGENVGLELIARFFRDICGSLIIEFVPKSDSNVQRLLANREDIFPRYDQSGFESAFARHFDLVERVEIADSQRSVYLFRGTSSPDRLAVTSA